MPDRLPESIDPLRYAEQGRSLRGSLKLADLERVAGMLRHCDGEVAVALRFGKDGRLPFLGGTVEAELELECQCCLEPLPLRVSSEFRLGLVDSLEAAGRLPEQYEPLLVEGDQLAIADIVQDELLLAIPYCPQHEQCRALVQQNPPATAERENPFGILADLIK